jgi:hypothetical protein
MHPDDPVDPGPILQLGTAFCASKTLLSAVELGVFRVLAAGPLPVEPLAEKLGLHRRGALDFFDGLVALGMLDRVDGVYSNTRATDLFLDPAKPSYIGGFLEMCNARLYPFWGNLTTALRTGLPQNELAGGGSDPFGELYSEPERLRQFLGAMTGISLGPARALTSAFEWERYSTFVDIGTAAGCVPVQLALAHPHLTGAGFDLPAVGPIFSDYVAGFGLAERVAFHAGDFFTEDLPTADVLIMGHILHDWDLDQKMMLLAKAHAALPDGGALVVYEGLIDDDRRTNAFGLLLSLTMLIETPGGFDYTGADCIGWMRQAGFRETRMAHLVGPDSMVIGYK